MIRGFCSDLPASGIARDFVSLAGMHSAPNMPSTGLALMIGSREADPIHPGLVALHGSGAVLEIPGAAPWGAAFLPSRGTCGRAVEYLRRDRDFILTITKRDQLGGDLLRDGAQRLPGVGLAHVFEHGAIHAREVVKACQGFGNVCRA